MMAETRYDIPHPAMMTKTEIHRPVFETQAEIFVPDWETIDRTIVLMALVVLHRHLLTDYVVSMDPEVRFMITDRVMTLINVCKGVVE